MKRVTDVWKVLRERMGKSPQLEGHPVIEDKYVAQRRADAQKRDRCTCCLMDVSGREIPWLLFGF